MQYRVTFTIGLDIDRKGMDITPFTQTSIAIGLRQYMADNFGGATFVEGKGVWNGGPNNTTVSENVMMIVVDFWATGMDEIQHHAMELAQIAEQQAVHVSAIAVYAVDVSHRGVVTE